MVNIYRYELEDGGGPFMTIQGHIRIREDSIYDADDGWISGCLSVELLKEWFRVRKIDTSNFILAKYSIPEKEIKHNTSHVIFPKKYLLAEGGTKI